MLFAGPEEAALVLGEAAPASIEGLLDALAGLTGGDVVIKRGADGCAALIAGERHDAAAVRVPVTDTVGAGDGFVAGYLADLVTGRSARERLATAVRCGAMACMSSGNWEGLPRRADLALLESANPVRR